jgi:hypothetical protein
VNILSGGLTSYGHGNVNSVNGGGQLFAYSTGMSNYNAYICNANGTTPETLTDHTTSALLLGGINGSGWTTVGSEGSSASVNIYNNAGGPWTLTSLGSLGSFGGQGFGIDAYGDVVGGSALTGNSGAQQNPFYVPYNGNGTWGAMVNLGDITAYESGYPRGVAYAINNGQIVGYSFTGTKSLSTEYAFISGTTNGSMVPLQSDVPGLASSNFGGTGRLSVADDIDSAGHIVGVGITSGGADDAYLLTPIATPEPSTLLLAASGLLGLLAYAWRKRK